MRVHHIIAAIVVPLWLFAAPAPARAALFSISLDTSGLVGQGEFQLNFQLIDGDGGVGSLITLSDFDFGGGSPVGDPVPAPPFANAGSGSLSTEVTLQDTAFFTSFTQGFLPGSTLAFLLEVTGSSDPSTPDYFTMALLDSRGFEVPTLGFAEELLSLALVTGAAPLSFGTDPARTNLNVPAPTVAAVPEPATALLVLTGTALIGVRRRSSSRARVSQDDAQSR